MQGVAVITRPWLTLLSVSMFNGTKNH
jgi:hypothetical protein